jgi:hypothetical protein
MMAIETLAVSQNSVPRACEAARLSFRQGLAGPQHALVVCVMAHRSLPFREADVFRAVRAIAKAIGQLPDSVLFPRDGGFTVMIGRPGDQKSAEINDNEVEDWIAKHVHQS